MKQALGRLAYSMMESALTSLAEAAVEEIHEKWKERKKCCPTTCSQDPPSQS